MQFPKPGNRIRKKRLERGETATKLRELRRQVFVRDGYRCRVCRRQVVPAGVDSLTRGDAHHLQYRSAGGKHQSKNLITLCRECHVDEHAHRIRIEGNGDVGIEVWRTDDAGNWFISRQEIAPGVVQRD